MSGNINPIMYHQYQATAYPMYGKTANGHNRTSYEFIQEVLNEVDTSALEAKIKVLHDKYDAEDTTQEQKFILAAMLRDANMEMAQLQAKKRMSQN